MRSVHVRFVLFTLSAGLFAAGAIAGCGGDDSGGTPTEDGGLPDTSVTGDDAGGGDGGAQDSGPGTHANANDLSVYLGQVASLDASGSVPPGVTFAWTVSSAPPGSAITTASLLNADTAKATFTPDKAGDYALQLAVSGGGASDQKTVTVHAVEAMVFYNTLDFNADGGPASAVNVVKASGADTHAVTCLNQPDGGAQIPEYSWFRAAYGSGDTWEAPAGQASRFALAAIERDNADGGAKSVLYGGTSESTCAAPPKALDSESAGPSILGHFSVRFSPDGNRLAFIDLADVAAISVRTVGFDGSNPHSIGPYKAYPDGGPQADGGNPGLGDVAVRWMGNQVAWANNNLGAGDRFQITVAADQDNATETPYLVCTGTLQSFDILPNGDVLALGSVTLADGAAPSATDLVVLHPNSLTKECEVVRNVTNLPPGSAALAASLSPDGARVAYVASDSTYDAGSGEDNARLYVAAVDGSSAPALLGAGPHSAGREPFEDFRHLAPRWIAGGTALSFQIQQDVIDAGDGGLTPAIAVASMAGGDVHAVARSRPQDQYYLQSFGGCSVSRGAGSAFMAFGSLGAFLALVLRRRRRS